MCKNDFKKGFDLNKEFFYIFKVMIDNVKRNVEMYNM